MKYLANDCIELKDLDYRYLEDMFEYGKDKRVADNAGFEVHTSLDDAHKMMKKLKDINEIWGIYHIKDKKLIGTIGVHTGKSPLTKVMVNGMGFELNPSYWGQGIMSMACDLVLEDFFMVEGKEEIYANHFSFNDRSKRFLIKYGMEFEGDWARKSNNLDNSLYKMTKKRFMEYRRK